MQRIDSLLAFYWFTSAELEEKRTLLASLCSAGTKPKHNIHRGNTFLSLSLLIFLCWCNALCCERRNEFLLAHHAHNQHKNCCIITTTAINQQHQPTSSTNNNNQQPTTDNNTRRRAPQTRESKPKFSGILEVYYVMKWPNLFLHAKWSPIPDSNLLEPIVSTVWRGSCDGGFHYVIVILEIA